nr:DUF3540 domain-containing protein [uncultured Desulfobulbus sp.]
MNATVGKVIPLVQKSAAKAHHALISRVNGREVAVVINGEPCQARVAFSCLVQPLPGDEVLCSSDGGGKWFVLAILERSGNQDMLLNFPGRMMLKSESATVATQGNLNFFSEREIHKSGEAVVDIKEVTACGETLQATYETFRMVSQLINTMARNVFVRVKNYVRQTEDHDQIKAGQLSRKVEGLYCMDSTHTIMVSKKDTKIDGERIHMG